jgi:hypothetical protein
MVAGEMLLPGTQLDEVVEPAVAVEVVVVLVRSNDVVVAWLMPVVTGDDVEAEVFDVSD